MIITRIAQILADHGIEHTIAGESVTAYEVVGNEHSFNKVPMTFNGATTVKQLKDWLVY